MPLNVIAQPNVEVMVNPRELDPSTPPPEKKIKTDDVIDMESILNEVMERFNTNRLFEYSKISFRPTSSLVESEELDSCLVIDEIGPQSSTASETDSMRIDGSPRLDSDIEIIATIETEHE